MPTASPSCQAPNRNTWPRLSLTLLLAGTLLGAVGMLAPELDRSPQPLAAWFKAGAQIFSKEGIEYLGE